MAKLVPQELEIVVVGLQHRVTSSTRRMLAEKVKSDILDATIEREPDNQADENAIKVILSSIPYKGLHVGYIPRGVAAVMAPAIDAGDIDISTAHGSVVDVDAADGTATMLLKFKSAVKTKAGKGGSKSKSKR